MRFAYHALVLDYDGTLTSGSRPEPRVLEALARARAAGRKLVLATGRILSELLRSFPEVERHFDALVLENGAVVRTPFGHHPVAGAVPAELDELLRQAGIAFRRGEAILATRADAAGAALEALGRLGLDCQLVRNREELMILPAGVSKAPARARHSATSGCPFTARSAPATPRTTSRCSRPASSASRWPTRGRR